MFGSALRMCPYTVSGVAEICFIAAASFATAAIVRLDLETGQLRSVNAGHPAPLILRGGSLLHPLACPPARPLGLQSGKPLECETRLVAR